MIHACIYTICFVFYYTLWRFYAFFGTNLLTRCHSASSLFLLFLCFRSYARNILGIGWNKSQNSYFSWHETKSEDETEGHQRAAVPPHGVGHPWLRHGIVWAPGPLPDAALPPIYSSRWENLKHPINFPRNLLQAVAVVDARSGGSRSSSWHPAGEGNHRRRPSSPPWSPPEWCVSSLPWTTGP
jgi:hypothetical protein